MKLVKNPTDCPLVPFQVPSLPSISTVKLPLAIWLPTLPKLVLLSALLVPLVLIFSSTFVLVFPLFPYPPPSSLFPGRPPLPFPLPTPLLASLCRFSNFRLLLILTPFPRYSLSLFFLFAAPLVHSSLSLSPSFLPSFLLLNVEKTGLLEDHARKTVIGHGVSLHACVLRPESRGYIGLLSKHPLAHPLIDPNYLSAPEDIDGLIYGIKEARKVNYFLFSHRREVTAILLIKST